MIKALAACANGMGSSQIIKMKIAKVFKGLNVEVKVDHMSIGEAKSAARRYDMVFCSVAMASNFRNLPETTKLVALKNLLDEGEITQKLTEALGIADAAAH